MELEKTIDELREQIAQLEAENATLSQEVRDLSVDEVTGIYGRKILDRETGAQFARCARGGRDFGVLMIDIDHFKRFNDDHGHAAGDRVLYQVAQGIRRHVRRSDTVGRYGGEEIMVAVDGSNLQDLQAYAERIRRSVEALDLDGLPGVTISIGAAIGGPDDLNAESVRERADVALYVAKKAGRNQVGS